MSVLRVVHTTSFRYAGPVTTSHNEVRMTPLSEAGQVVEDASVSIEPLTWRHDYRDYWGTAVTAFEVTGPHTELVITARSRVRVTPAGSSVSLVDWDMLRRPLVADQMAEYLALSPTTQPPGEVVALARAAATGHPPDDAAAAICSALHDAVEYVPGATAVQSTASDAWRERKGVCQDIAHLSVGALRSAGIPARYVSGYLHPVADAVGQTVVGQSHAWVEWWAGRWHAFDPTNRSHVGEHHVVLARGREYQDVAPLSGIFAGAGTTSHAVEVQITEEG